jgi:hypothetical protein
VLDLLAHLEEKEAENAGAKSRTAKSRRKEAPDIVAAILNGDQPAGLTASRLARWKTLPFDWTEQRKLLGFS